MPDHHSRVATLNGTGVDPGTTADGDWPPGANQSRMSRIVVAVTEGGDLGEAHAIVEGEGAMQHGLASLATWLITSGDSHTKT